MERNGTLKDLVGQDLAGCRIVEMTEVYRVDDDGLRSKTLGFFKDPDIAAAFAGVQTDAPWHRTSSALVLTDGGVGYVVEDMQPIMLFDDEAEALDIRNKVLARMSPAERKLFGFGGPPSK